MEYIPLSTRPEEQPGKPSGSSKVGILCGHELEAKGRWTKPYYVWNLENFASIPLRADIDVSNVRLDNPARVQNYRNDW